MKLARAVRRLASAASAVILACAEPDSPPFNVGRPATAAEIAEWDIDVDADGRGLPPGEGDALTGERLYGELCASCHGARGEGTTAAAQLIKPKNSSVQARRNIASHWPYAPPLFDYIRRTMPPDRPQSYGADTLYAITAFLLRENEIAVPAGRVSRATLPAVRMPSRAAFVNDDRRGGTQLR